MASIITSINAPLNVMTIRTAAIILGLSIEATAAYINETNYNRPIITSHDFFLLPNTGTESATTP